MLLILGGISLICITFTIALFYFYNKDNKELKNIKKRFNSKIIEHEVFLKDWEKTTCENDQLKLNLEKEADKNIKILSQKKSSEVRLGQIGESLVPFLSKCPYDPKLMSFLGNPIDFIVFDYDQGEIIFLEVKTGKSQLSKRQKLIKNIIKTGKVYYDTIRVDEKGVKHKRIKNFD